MTIRKSTQQLAPYPWERPGAKDPFKLQPRPGAPADTITADAYDRSAYDEVVGRLALGKAPGPDGIPNECLKYLHREVHDVIHGLFLLMQATR